MEMEYKDTNRRGKFVIIVGVVLAIGPFGDGQRPALPHQHHQPPSPGKPDPRAPDLHRAPPSRRENKRSIVRTYDGLPDGYDKIERHGAPRSTDV